MIQFESFQTLKKVGIFLVKLRTYYWSINEEANLH